MVKAKSLIMAPNVLLFPQHRHSRNHHYILLTTHCPASLTFMILVHRYRKFTYATLKGPRASLLKTVLKQAKRRNLPGFTTVNFENLSDDFIREK